MTIRILGAARRYAASSEWVAVKKPISCATVGRALDVGAGRGISAHALASEGWIVTALEPNLSELVGAGAIRRLAKESTLKIEVMEEWGENLPFEDAAFDLVHCRRVMHHARDLTMFCSEIGRVLRRGGLFVATRAHVVSRPEDVLVFQNAHPLHRLCGGENAFMLQQYLDAIRCADIKVSLFFNPYQRDISIFPDTRTTVKRRWATRLLLPFPKLIPDILLNYAGERIDTPWRLYTFFGTEI